MIRAVAHAHAHLAGGALPGAVRDLVGEALGKLGRRRGAGTVDQREPAGGDGDRTAGVGRLGAHAQRRDLEYLVQGGQQPVV